MQKREPFKAPAYQVTEPRADYIQRLAAAFEAWANQDDATPTPQPEAKPYAAMAREWYADIYDAADMPMTAKKVREGAEATDTTAAIEALRANIAALVEPVGAAEFHSKTVYSGVVVSALKRAGFTIIRTPDHD